MKYDIYLWEHPAHLPPLKTFEQGAQEFQALESIDMGVANPKLIAFGEQLAQRFPGADNFAPDSAEAQDAPWPTSPAISAADATCAVYLMGVPNNQWEHVMAAAVEIGTAVGLTVLIDQLSILFLPSGEILPEEKGGVIWENFLGALEDMKKPGNELLSKPDLRKLMVAEIQKILKPVLRILTEVRIQKILKRHGFKAERWHHWTVAWAFSRKTPNGEQLVHYTIKGRFPDYTAELYFLVTDNAVAAVWNDGVKEEPGATYVFKLGYFMGNPEVPLPMGTSHARAQVLSLVADNAMKLLNQSTTLQNIDSLLNGTEHQGLRFIDSYLALDFVIVAWLVRNPQLQTYIDYYLAHMELNDHNRRKWELRVKRLDAVVAYFQQHPDYKDIVVRTRLKASA
jgi:hypothetical protein